MTTEEFYEYLKQARRRLWKALVLLSNEELSRPLIQTTGNRCIKDFLIHTAMVEDAWFRGDLLGGPLVMETFGGDKKAFDGEHHHDKPLEWILAYWEAVEKDTLARWPEIMRTVSENKMVAPFDEEPENKITAMQVVWHEMQHEVRHTAQVVQLIRLLGHKPPALDLLFLVT